MRKKTHLHPAGAGQVLQVEAIPFAVGFAAGWLPGALAGLLAGVGQWRTVRDSEVQHGIGQHKVV